MTGVALVIGQGFVMNWYYHKKTGLDMVRFWKQMGNVYVVPVTMCAVTLLLSRVIDFYRIPVLLAGIVIYTVVYCALNWRFTMNGYEKDLVLGRIKKRG